MSEKFLIRIDRPVQAAGYEIASSDETERLFLQIAKGQGLLVEEAGVIQIKREKRGKGDKRTTVPDFLVKENASDEGIYVEVTESNAHSGNKGAQRRVMTEAGLASRYVQLTGTELESVRKKGEGLMRYIKIKIENRDS